MIAGVVGAGPGTVAVTWTLPELVITPFNPLVTIKCGAKRSSRKNRTPKEVCLNAIGEPVCRLWAKPSLLCSGFGLLLVLFFVFIESSLDNFIVVAPNEQSDYVNNGHKE